jgi:23S rRNA pseudouridine1911/1915/1917 synthase
MKPSIPEILFEDNHLLVINKPAGLLSQGDDSGHRSVLDVFKDYLKEKYNKPGNVYLGLVHRLDRPVSGVMVLARTSKAAARLSAQFRDKKAEKTYMALVTGKPTRRKGTLEHHMGSGARSDGRTPISDRPFTDSRKATLDYEVLNASEDTSLLKLKPVTGRRHQIRAQLSMAGVPVLGDVKYGSAIRGKDRAITLHAWRLVIEHPVGGRRMVFETDPPRDGLWRDQVMTKR